MKRRLYLAAACSSFAVLAFAQTTDVGPTVTGDQVLKPGQTWTVERTSGLDTPVTFTVTLPNDPAYNQDGMLIFAENYNPELIGQKFSWLDHTYAWFDPIDGDGEFLLFHQTDGKSGGFGPYCMVNNPSQSKDFTSFEGYFFRDPELIGATLDGDTDGLGSCTIKLSQ